MANLSIDWKAECENCGHRLGEGWLEDHAPERTDFDTSTCDICGEEVCEACGDVKAERHHACLDEEGEGDERSDD